MGELHGDTFTSRVSRTFARSWTVVYSSAPPHSLVELVALINSFFCHRGAVVSVPRLLIWSPTTSLLCVSSIICVSQPSDSQQRPVLIILNGHEALTTHVESWRAKWRDDPALADQDHYRSFLENSQIKHPLCMFTCPISNCPQTRSWTFREDFDQTRRG